MAAGRALVAASATGARSISLLERVIIEFVLFFSFSLIAIKIDLVESRYYSEMGLRHSRLRHRRPHSDRAVRPVGSMREIWYYGVAIQTERRIRNRGRVIPIETFLGRELVNNPVLRPPRSRTQFARPDARRGSAHFRQPLQHISSVHLFFK